MDWQSADHKSSVGTFLLTGIIIVLMVIQMWPKPDPPTQQAQTTKGATGTNRADHADPPTQPVSGGFPVTVWIMPSILSFALIAAGALHWKAASVRKAASSMPSDNSNGQGAKYNPTDAPSVEQKGVPRIKFNEVLNDLNVCQQQRRNDAEARQNVIGVAERLWVLKERLREIKRRWPNAKDFIAHPLRREQWAIGPKELVPGWWETVEEWHKDAARMLARENVRTYLYLSVLRCLTWVAASDRVCLQ